MRQALRWLQLLDVAAVSALAVAAVSALVAERADLPGLSVLAMAAMAAATPFIALRRLHCRAAATAFLEVLADRSARLASQRRPNPEVRRRVHEILDAANGMTMVFQPIVRLADSAVVGHEALARFDDGRLPDRWFAEAAEAGLGTELEVAAIALAMANAPADGYLSVNASPDTLGSAALHALLASHARADGIVLEVTEHAVVGDYAATIDAVRTIRELGGRVAVDDAGSGISSFQHVLRLRPELVKLDRWIVDHIDEDPARQALVRFMVAFAEEVDVELVAEGLERAEELQECRALGVAYAQGFLIGRPKKVGGTAGRAWA